MLRICRVLCLLIAQKSVGKNRPHRPANWSSSHGSTTHELRDPVQVIKPAGMRLNDGGVRRFHSPFHPPPSGSPENSLDSLAAGLPDGK